MSKCNSQEDFNFAFGLVRWMNTDKQFGSKFQVILRSIDIDTRHVYDTDTTTPIFKKAEHRHVGDTLYTKIIICCAYKHMVEYYL